MAQPIFNPSSAMDAYQYVQTRRDEALKLFEKQPEKGLAIEMELLQFLSDPKIVTLGQGFPYLSWKKSDLYYDIALGYLALDQKDKALAALQRMHEELLLNSSSKLLLDNKDLENLQHEKSFKQFIQQIQNRENFWDGPALKTPFKDNLSEDEKVAGLSKLWSEIKYNFVYFDQVPALDWDALYLSYLPKVRQTKNTIEYYRLLQHLVAQLHDGHTNVYPPEQLNDAFYARPPIRTRLVAGKVLITQVWGDQTELRPGLEITGVDGLSVKQYASTYVAPYQSASTTQDLEVRTYDYLLLAGPLNFPVKLQLLDEAGKTFAVTVQRQKIKRPPQPALQFKKLANDVAYIALNTFENKKVVEEFIATADQWRTARAIIFDLRENDGGDSALGDAILSYLTDKPFTGLLSRTREYRPVERAQGVVQHWFDQPDNPVEPQQKPYLGPVIVLVSARTFSAGEDFVADFQAMHRGKIVGEPTGGSTGQPLIFSLPGGGRARVCTKREAFADGQTFVGAGIQPDIFVQPGVEDIRANRDPVLQAALEALQLQP
ncbi:S41 family peptidase [Gloeobacter kilaueensis]|uniref:S41 family peptidase n=1 Tax=Gloeobacter kilaueensis TaxID=1416614 RepID=UPI001651967E|nr:S41 family peptidase [Gloeobacter kilaueensis]